jgi:hypothetical protein
MFASHPARSRVALAVVAAFFGAAIVIAAPAGAHVADWGHNWTEHIRPKTDARYYTKTQADSRYVAKASTLRGAYYVSGEAAAIDGYATTEISFGITFPTAPTSHFIPAGQPVPAGCSGTVSAPGAAHGHLCIFEANGYHAKNHTTCNPATVACPGASRYGAGIVIYSDHIGAFDSIGTWAATP